MTVKELKEGIDSLLLGGHIKEDQQLVCAVNRGDGWEMGYVSRIMVPPVMIKDGAMKHDAQLLFESKEGIPDWCPLEKLSDPKGSPASTMLDPDHPLDNHQFNVDDTRVCPQHKIPLRHGFNGFKWNWYCPTCHYSVKE